MRHTLLLCCLLLTTPFLVGSSCAFFFSTGDSDPRSKDPNDPPILTARGQFIGEPVSGIAFESGSVSGVTGENGEFTYEEGGTVSFFLGDIPLGDEIEGREIVTPIDLVEGGDANDPAVINIARLLQSLDATPGDDDITIPASVSQDAVTTSSTLYWAIESLDFGDEEAFANAGSALVAALTQDYPHAATLVDAGAAQKKMLRSISARQRQRAETAQEIQ